MQTVISSAERIKKYTQMHRGMNTQTEASFTAAAGPFLKRSPKDAVQAAFIDHSFSLYEMVSAVVVFEIISLAKLCFSPSK